jgi:hypothetical protein
MSQLGRHWMLGTEGADAPVVYVVPEPASSIVLRQIVECVCQPSARDIQCLDVVLPEDSSALFVRVSKRSRPRAMSPNSRRIGPCPCHPKQRKTRVEGEIDHHASQRWPHLEEVTIRWRGSYGYLTGHLPGDEDIPMARIGYLGSPNEWAFAIYQASTESYQQSVLLNGQLTGAPTEALDCACTHYLTDTTDHARSGGGCWFVGETARAWCTCVRELTAVDAHRFRCARNR